MKKILLLSILLLAALSARSQVDRPAMCHSDEQMKQFYKNNPNALQEALKFEELTRTRKNTTGRTGGYVIPVVFHVFGTDFAGKTVTDNTIITALEKVNEDFYGLNDDYSTVSSLFQDIRATLNIEFKLAKIDPNGNPTTGINYYPERAGFGNGGGYDDQIRQYAWDNYKYMNVYIMLDLYDDNSYTNSGVAWYPDTWMSDNDLARVVYNGRYLYGNTDKEFASVLTHEFGHWLNLAHTFDNECSAPGDNVDDTPPTTSNYGTCNVTSEKCSGAGIPNAENYMDYSDCYKMFTQGQVARMVTALDHAARHPLWQESNLTATGVNDAATPFLLYSASVLHEDDGNAGGIEGSVTISGQNGAEFAVTGALTSGTHFTTSNVPSGLSVQISVQSSTSATLSISGNATAHANSDDVSNISISFLDAAIAGGTSSIQNPTFNGFSLNFKDPYAIVYKDITDIVVNSSATWTFFDLAYGDGRYGCWYDGGKLRLETYTKPLVCEGTTRNISLLTSGTPIGSGSNWIAGGVYPDEHDLRTSSYTAWDGQSGYIGFKVTSPEGKNLHGWFRVTVNATGSSFTLHDYAYYSKPEGTIAAGSTTISFPPVAAFTASSTTITAGQAVAFTDASSGEATSWSWSFPGGTPETSAEQNPVVTYNTVGTYDVTLTVNNVNGSDTKTSTGYITVNPASATYCTSASSRSTYEHIANVQVGSFSNASGAANYSDYTHLIVDASKGNNTVTLTPGFSGSTYSEYFRIWIDYNQDGDFSDIGELVFDAGSTSTTAVSGIINVPSSALIGATRMRVSMKYLSAPEPCGTIGDGEVEDYTVNISGTTVTAPDNLVANVVNSGSISLTWSDNSDNEDGFEIERSTTADVFSVIASVGANTASYTDNGLSANTNYSYRVRAKSESSYSSYSNSDSATTPEITMPSYCTADAGNPSGQYIKSVKIGSIDNSTSYETNGYSDFTAMSASLNGSATLTVTPHYSWSATQAKAWIDWNRDGDFSDSGEQVLSGIGSAASYSSAITVPATASGPVRLRIRVAYGEAPTACGSIYFSETEDYTLYIGTAAGPVASSFEKQVTLFPNPAREGRFQVVIPEYEGSLEISIYSLQGLLIHQQTFTDEDQSNTVNTISLKQNVQGTYLVHIKSNNSTAVSKIIFE